MWPLLKVLQVCFKSVIQTWILFATMNVVDGRPQEGGIRGQGSLCACAACGAHLENGLHPVEQRRL